MTVLALDSALDGCSVAVWHDDGSSAGRTLAAECREAATGQAEMLVPMIARAMQAAGLDFGALTGLAVTVGPGHFTGLRAGLAAARGLAVATRLPLRGVTTLLAVAAAVEGAQPDATLVVALDSKRAEAFYQAFGPDLSPRGGPETMTPERYAARLAAGGTVQGGPLVLAGSGATALAQCLPARAVTLATVRRPDAVVVARLSVRHAAAARPPQPLYLHAPSTTSPAPRQAVTP